MNLKSMYKMSELRCSQLLWTNMLSCHTGEKTFLNVVNVSKLTTAMSTVR